jgi:hypothetical protein
VKRHLMVGATVVGVFIVACVLAVQFVGWWTLPVGATVVAAAWLGGRCWHHDVSLLPPVRGGGPDREYARWYCHRCGATWAADLEASTRPRPLHLGYDQAKAEQSAVRADALERERRRMAVERAGLSKQTRDDKPAVARPRPVTGSVTVAVESSSPALSRVAGARVRRVSVDAAAASLDESRLTHRRPADELARIRPIRG